MWVQLTKTKYLKINKDFLRNKKNSTASIAKKNILDHTHLLWKGLIWILGDGKTITFWYDIWIEESPLVHKINPNMWHCM